MIERFRYHASTTGFSGRITLPFDEIVPAQASLALPASGGFGTARVDHFSFHGIFAFESAEALVAGSFSPEDRSFDAVATVTITGLNILGMVTADRVVARIASSHPENPENGYSITPIGSYFENLRIAGHLVEIDLATDTFHRLDNMQKVREAYMGDPQFRDELDKLTLAGRSDVPDFLRRHFPRLREPAIAEPGRLTAFSLVRKIGGLPPGLLSELPCVGHVIRVRGFGIIRLAEFTMTDAERSITMLQVDLGSTPAGKGSTGTAAGNGSDG